MIVKMVTCHNAEMLHESKCSPCNCTCTVTIIIFLPLEMPLITHEHNHHAVRERDKRDFNADDFMKCLLWGCSVSALVTNGSSVKRTTEYSETYRMAQY
jgi:L-ascorbate metabolism protein UlaG (beta-lactamase superfamily)